MKKLNQIAFLAAAVTASALLSLAQAPTGQAAVPQPVVAATASQFECSGFISDDRIGRQIYVANGSDNDLYEATHQFKPGEYVYLKSHGAVSLQPGNEYSLVRADTAPLFQVAWLPNALENRIVPPASWYTYQAWHLKRLGQAYNNTGQVRVTRLTPEGAVAEVITACGDINPGDLAIPFQPQPIPTYVPSATFDRFAPANGKQQGLIVSTPGDSPFLAKGDIAYLNLGQEAGVQPGQKFRVFTIFRDNLVQGWEQLRGVPKSPRETLGEIVVLSVQKKSSVAMVVKSLREITVGDGIELE